jgi:MSHA biogenesis protein MshN
VSLINKMLQDLEARQDAASVAVEPAYHGLHPVRAGSRSVARVLWLAVVFLMLAVVAYVGIDRLLPSNDRPVVVVAPIEKPPAEAAASPITSAPSVMTTPVPPAEAPTPPAAVTAAPAPPKPIASPAPDDAKLHSSAVAAQSTRSRAATPPGIVKKAETPRVAASGHARRPAEVDALQPKIDATAASSGDAPALLVDKKVRPLTAEEKAEEGYRHALQLLDQGRSDGAVGELREVLSARPTHVKARELAAGIELQNGHWREAEKLLEEGMRQVPNQYLFARMLARVYVDHGAEAKALAVMESAGPAASDDGQFSALLGLLYQRAGRAAAAVKAYERAVSLAPADGRSWLGFAIALESTNQWDAAKSAYRRAQETDLSPSLARYAEQRLAALNNR